MHDSQQYGERKEGVAQANPGPSAGCSQIFTFMTTLLTAPCINVLQGHESLGHKLHFKTAASQTMVSWTPDWTPKAEDGSPTELTKA